MSVQELPNRPPHAPSPLRIVNWPLRDDGWSAWLMVAAMLAVGLWVGIVAANMALGAFTVSALAVSVWRLWLPVTFDFGTRGIVQTCWTRRRRIPWPQVARYEVLARGVLLSADTEHTVLSPLRSIYVRWNEKRDDLIEVLEFFLDPTAQQDLPTS